MKFLILVLTIAPIYATSDVFGDLLGQEFQEYSSIDHVREKRQAGNQALQHIRQLQQQQNYRPPLVPIPPQPIPKLGPSQPIQPQQLTQNQVSQYRPQVTFSSGAQQPDYRAVQANAAQYKKPIIPQQPQYRPQPVPQQPQYRPQPIPQQNYNVGSQKLPPHIQQLVQYQKNLGNNFPQRG